MTERTSTGIMKSSSEGELLERDETRLISSNADCECFDQRIGSNRYAESKLKRTFTLPRNPFVSSRMSKRKAKHKDSSEAVNKGSSVQTISEVNGDPKCNKKLFRKPSWRKFLNKMFQHVSSVSVPNNRSFRSFDKRRTEVSLSSSDIRVPPTRPNNINFSDKVPGVIGLRNHGNTCFINAVLQCLSHTDILAEYFVLDQYKVDLSRRNKLNSKKYGTKGEVTEQLAMLLKSIWSCQYDPEISNQFKNVVDKYGSQYRGGNQHDAQEFLLWLLDKVHEDLNTATKKKYKIIKNSFGRPDEAVAEETLANHKRCNNSFVHDLFQAQFRSSLTCPKCLRQSNTFDPFLCASVPVPQTQRRSIFATVLYLSQQPRQVRLGLALPVQAEVRELRDALSSDTGIEPPHMLLTEVDDLGFHRTFADSQSISIVTEQDPLYCIELPQLRDASEESGAYLLLVWVNVLVLDDHVARFGSPYTMQVGRETSYEDLQKLILKEMNTVLHDDVLVNAQDIPLFRMRVLDGISAMVADSSSCKLEGGPTYLDPTLDHPLYMEAVEQALALCTEGAPPHVKLVLEWDLHAKEATIADDGDQIEELASVKQMKNSPESAGAVSLEECFELYTRAEILGAEDAWHCPYCNRKQEVVKKLGLWSLPDILVIHLKRFRQSSKQRSTAKLTTLVDFPLHGFDMGPHLADRLPSSANGVVVGGGLNGEQGPLGGLGWSPWKRPRSRHAQRRDDEDNVYDLYAICNHHGQDLQGGHYTAYCRNPYDGQWYAFDDTRVERIGEEALVTPAAYILFYQHRSLGSGASSTSGSTTSSSGGGATTPTSNNNGSSGQQSSASTSSGTTDHWVYRMPAFEFCPASAKVKKLQEPFPRHCLGYSTLQPSCRHEVRRGTDEHHSDDEVPLAMAQHNKQMPALQSSASSPLIVHVTTEGTTQDDLGEPPSPPPATDTPSDESSSVIAESSV
ncbi:ubiquitin carboxyl-terminal hydrolase 43 isoform X2 [Ischnura elegans]|uniref:ubiquitin carboxyl-terminal hydrolase 43 isoform X2 n=1 Tax=Ischnura elegans TaxID=197161 RepID=UPI001ED87E00|nr:ubiquitin carboxyl-terminal hydrolase 43 isoform X2 [Ischnura elegans]